MYFLNLNTDTLVYLYNCFYLIFRHCDKALMCNLKLSRKPIYLLKLIRPASPSV